MKNKITTIAIFISIVSTAQDSIVKMQIKKDWSTIFAISTAVPLATSLFFEKNKSIPYTVAAITAGISIGLSTHKKGYLRNGMFAIAGVLDAFNRELGYHNEKVFEKMPYLSERFFGVNSWKNKYNANYPFATTLLVGTTDGDHASRTLNKGFVIGGMIALDYKGKNFKHHLKQILVGAFIYTSTKGLTHYYFNN